MSKNDLLRTAESFIPTDSDLMDVDPEDLFFEVFVDAYNNLCDAEGSAHGERTMLKSILLSLILSNQAPILPFYVPGEC